MLGSEDVGVDAMASAAKKVPALMTVDEFLDWPGDGSGRVFDLVDGVVRAQAAHSGEHGTIQTRVATLLTNYLDAHHPGCRVVTGGGVKPKLQAHWNFRIPDLIVTCARNTKSERSIVDPVIAIEILSPSNKAETWDNVRNYTTIPSVCEIIVIHSDRILADVLTRDANGHWPDNPLIVGPGAMVPLASIGFNVPIIDAYRGTYLESGTAAA
jgi:Uma2 family endonuclease